MLGTHPVQHSLHRVKEIVLAVSISTLPSYYCNGACPLSEVCARIFMWNHWAGRDGREVRRVAMLVHLVGGSGDSRREKEPRNI